MDGRAFGRSPGRTDERLIYRIHIDRDTLCSIHEGRIYSYIGLRSLENITAYFAENKWNKTAMLTFRLPKSQRWSNIEEKQIALYHYMVRLTVRCACVMGSAVSCLSPAIRLTPRDPVPHQLPVIPFLINSL